MKLPLHKALLLILSSTLLISGTAYTLYFFSRSTRESRHTDPRFTLTHLAHPGTLPTPYLASLLEPHPDNLYALDLSRAQQQLLSSPYIANAQLSLSPPHTLTIRYTTHQPLARLLDQTHTALSSAATLIPSDQDDLPALYLGDGDPQLARHVLTLCPDATFLDVSAAIHQALGRRQIVLQIDGHLLRLSPTHLESALANYRRLKPHLEPYSVVDLRLEELAFVSKGAATCLTMS